MSITNIRGFVDRLLVTGHWVPPAVVFVEDYRDRAETAAALRDEADIHGVNLQEFSNLETLESRLPEFSAARKDGALLLVNTDEGARWGVWLEANREKLLEWFALTLILIMPDEWPRLVRVAPSFYSWTKGQIVQARELTQPSIGVEELEAAMEDMRQATDLTPEQFIQAWAHGKLPDTYRNSAWLNLATAWLAWRGS
jgi:hypothetical protein